MIVQTLPTDMSKCKFLKTGSIYSLSNGQDWKKHTGIRACQILYEYCTPILYLK